MSDEALPLYRHLFTEETINCVASLFHFRETGDLGQRGWAERELEARLGKHGCTLADFENAALDRWHNMQRGHSPRRASGTASIEECTGCAEAKGWPGPHDYRLLPSRTPDHGE